MSLIKKYKLVPLFYPNSKITILLPLNYCKKVDKISEMINS